MFGVNERPSRSGQPFRYGRNILFFVLFISFVAGPGFLAYALIGALYRDLPVTPVDQRTQSAQGVRPSSSATESQIPFPAATASNEETPFMAYRRLRDSAKGIESSSTTALSRRPGAAGKQTFRTVCVRLCDGYYFPIGFSATADQFAQHEAACRSRCGAPARLFVYPNPGANPDQMRDLAGNPYLKLKNAFRYHVKFNAACSCQPQPWTVASKQRHQVYASVSQGGVGRGDARTEVDGKPQSTPRLASLEVDGIRRDHAAMPLPAVSGTQDTEMMRDAALAAVLAAKHERANLLAKVAPTSEQWADYDRRALRKRRSVAVAGWSKRRKRPQLSASEILRRNIEHRY